jgi:hypothetical protein
LFDKIIRTFMLLVGSVIGATFGTLFLGGFLLSECVPGRAPIPRGLAETRLASEESVATSLGFVREREEELHEPGPIVRELSVERGACVAALAGFFGGSSPRSIAIVPRGGVRDDPRVPDTLAAHLDIAGVVGHVAWCADRDVEVDVVVLLAQPGDDPPGVILRLLRAPASVGLTSDRLVRGHVLRDPASVLGPLDAAPPPADAAMPPDAGVDAGRPSARGRRRAR